MSSTEPINIYAAKTQLSRLIERALAGEEIVIARAGKPLVRLVPVGSPSATRRPGAWHGKVDIHQDFDELPDEIARAFRGETT